MKRCKHGIIKDFCGACFPAPAAPEVQQPLQPVDHNRSHAGWNIKGEPVYLDEPLAPDVAEMVKRLRERARVMGAGIYIEGSDATLMYDAAVLLAKLGQGWIPMDRTAEYQEHHFKVEDVGVAWNGNRVWVCADSGALLRAKVIGEKLFVEFTPPTPGASDD